jgi:hypothetical protein
MFPFFVFLFVDVLILNLKLQKPKITCYFIIFRICNLCIYNVVKWGGEMYL